MARRRYRDFRGGLVPSGPREDIHENALRRARGIWPVRTPSIRSRNGTSLIDTIPNDGFGGAVHSFFRFREERFYGAGVSLYRSSGGILTNLAAGAGGAGILSGHPLSFVST